MTTNRALRASLLVIALSGAAWAEIFQANIVTEDGSPLPVSLQIIPSLNSALENECQIINIFGSGSVQYGINYRNRSYDPASADMCSVTIRLKGFQPVQATLQNHGTVVLKHIGGLHEGSTVTATSLNAPELASGPRRISISPTRARHRAHTVTLVKVSGAATPVVTRVL